MTSRTLGEIASAGDCTISDILSDLGFEIGETKCSPAPLPGADDSRAADLFHYRCLPDPWKNELLKSIGSSLEEAATYDLLLALSPRPVLEDTWATELAGRFKIKPGRRPTPKQAAIIEVAADTWRDHVHACEEWEAAQVLRPIAKQIIERTRILAAFDMDAIALIAIDDSDIYAMAEDRAAAALSRHEGMVERGEAGLHRRELDPAIHRRRIRRESNGTAIHAAGALKLIGGPKAKNLPSYSDFWSVRRWLAHQDHTAAKMSERMIRNEAGDSVCMSKVIANSKNAKVASWYAMALGLNKIAADSGHATLFLTLSLPGKYHPHPSNDPYRTSTYDPNISPRDACRLLTKKVHNALSMLGQQGFRPRGIRVAEPHADGCPHMHIELHAPEYMIPAIKKAFKHHFGKGDEAVKIKEWEADGDASAASYVMHYILKALGEGNKGDKQTETDAVNTWGSQTGIRRIGFFGMSRGIIGVFRTAYRSMKHADRTGVRPTCPRARAIQHAMRRARWDVALVLCGAFSDEPRLVSIREEKENRWGDLVKVTTGYANPHTGEIVFECRPIKWTIVLKSEGQNVDTISVSVSYPRPPADQHENADAAVKSRPPDG